MKQNIKDNVIFITLSLTKYKRKNNVITIFMIFQFFEKGSRTSLLGAFPNPTLNLNADVSIYLYKSMIQRAWIGLSVVNFTSTFALWESILFPNRLVTS